MSCHVSCVHWYCSQWMALFDLRSVEKTVMTLYSRSLVFADGLVAKSLWLLLYTLFCSHRRAVFCKCFFFPRYNCTRVPNNQRSKLSHKREYTDSVRQGISMYVFRKSTLYNSLLHLNQDFIT